jgi:hypothetical protein
MAFVSAERIINEARFLLICYIIMSTGISLLEINLHRNRQPLTYCLEDKLRSRQKYS